MSDPLQVRLSAPKQRFTVGEGVVLDLAIRVDIDLEMETVELNRSRTRIVVSPTDSNQPAIELTGQDHITRFSVHPLAQVGIQFQAPAGSEWTVQLELLKYTSPLIAGRYKVKLSYRYGDTPDQTIVTNEVEIEVVAATVVSTRYRWFGHNLPYKSLCSVWTARVGDSIRWFYQEADSRHPAKIQFATEIYASSASAPRVENPPRLGHLNDISGMHFHRFVIWTEPGAVDWLRIHAGGTLGAPDRVEHQLTDAFLADPPLQRRAGGFAVVLVGKNDEGASVATLFEVDAQGNRTERNIQLPGPADVAVVLWKDDDTLDSIYFYSANDTDIMRSGFADGDSQTLAIGGPIDALAIDQWHGGGYALALTREADFLQVVAWRTENGEESRTEYDLASMRIPNAAFVGWSVDPGAHDASLVMRETDSWTVLDQRRQFRVPFNTGNARLRGAPTIVSCPDGLFLVFHDPTSGFNSLRLGEAPPDPKL